MWAGVHVPDEAAAAVIRNTAEQLRLGRDVLLLVRPEGIPDEWMPELAARMSAMLAVAAGAPAVSIVA